MNGHDVGLLVFTSVVYLEAWVVTPYDKLRNSLLWLFSLLRVHSVEHRGIVDMFRLDEGS